MKEAPAYVPGHQLLAGKSVLITAAAALAAPSPVLAQAGPDFDKKEWPIERGGRSRDPYVAPDGKVFFAGQQGNYVGRLDPASGEVRYYELEGFGPDGGRESQLTYEAAVAFGWRFGS